MKEWLSAHLDFGGKPSDIYTTRCDQILFGLVQPFLIYCQEQAWIERYFFIRYADPESHVRLRLFGDAKVLHAEVAPALLQVANGRGLGVRWVPYEQEIDRYGGVPAIELAERFFELSSDIAFELLPKIIRGKPSLRSGQALLLMTTLIHIFCEEVQPFAAYYGQSYLQTLTSAAEQAHWHARFDDAYQQQAQRLGAYVTTTVARLATGEALTETLDHYRDGLIPLRDQLRVLYQNGALPYATWRETVWSIVPSYLHMMNNRLGVSIAEESYLAFLIAKTLREVV